MPAERLRGRVSLLSPSMRDCVLTIIPRCAPFVYDAWTNPKTLAIISQVAGVDLVPVMDFEIGHVNLSVQSEEEKTKALAATVEKQSWKAEKDMPDYHLEDNDPIVDWHTDSYPFVCVTMLSDCTNMVGGETALRKGNGEVVKVRGPQMVSSLSCNVQDRTLTEPGIGRDSSGTVH